MIDGNEEEERVSQRVLLGTIFPQHFLIWIFRTRKALGLRFFTNLSAVFVFGIFFELPIKGLEVKSLNELIIDKKMQLGVRFIFISFLLIYGNITAFI